MRWGSRALAWSCEVPPWNFTARRFAGIYFFFLSGAWVKADPATDLSLEDDFLSFSCSLAFEATPLLVFSLLAMVRSIQGVPSVARCLTEAIAQA